SAKGTRPRASSVILVYLFGGCSHIDTFDMKPDAPEGIRGEFDPVATKVPGTRFCELLPKLGQLADKFAVIRSMAHDQTLHTASVGFALSGVRPVVIGGRAPRNTVDDHPNLGSAIARFRPPEKPVPGAVTFPNTLRDGGGTFAPGQTGGLLGASCDPWFI